MMEDLEYWKISFSKVTNVCLSAGLAGQSSTTTNLIKLTLFKVVPSGVVEPCPIGVDPDRSEMISHQLRCFEHLTLFNHFFGGTDMICLACTIYW